MRLRILGAACLTACVWFSGCAGSGVSSIKPLGDGQFRLQCKLPLRDCLERVESHCRDEGYTLLNASEEQRRAGVEPVMSEHVESRAIFRCGPSEEPAQGPKVVKAAAAPEPSATSCLPGASQACVGPGGCAGGQSCLPDGSGLGPCDCGSAEPVPSSTATATGSAPAPATSAPVAPAAPAAPAPTSAAPVAPTSPPSAPAPEPSKQP